MFMTLSTSRGERSWTTYAVSTGAETRFPGVGSAGCVSAFTLPRTLNAEVTGYSFPSAKLFTNMQ